MATKQAAINASVTSSQVMAADTARKFIYIQNFDVSSGDMWVAFGQAATAGNNGEVQIQAGTAVQFGGYTSLGAGSYVSTCPTESVNVVTGTGTATGCVLTT